jgi:hypothetical protein
METNNHSKTNSNSIFQRLKFVPPHETMCLCSGNKHTDMLQQQHCSLFLPVNCQGKQAVWALLFLPVLELLAQIQRKLTTATPSLP